MGLQDRTVLRRKPDTLRSLHATHTLTQKIAETAIAAATGSMGVGDEEPNGKIALVIDTRSGKHCFEWNSSTNLLVAGQLHADIDPSGRLVAIVTPTALNIYKLPGVCVAK